MIKKIMLVAFLSAVCMYAAEPHHALANALESLQRAYPDYIVAFDQNGIIWRDGTHMAFGEYDPHKTTAAKLERPALIDHLLQSRYTTGAPTEVPQDDPGRVRYEPFFRTMYGNSADEVAQHLVPIMWMPNVFHDDSKTLHVTTVNNVHEKIQTISSELEDLVDLHPEYMPFLENPGGTFNWRTIANTNRLSAHSFGMTLDINAHQSTYWQWDLAAQGRDISEETELEYRNTIPWDIVAIFEKHGFIWGGKWYHYDTMHFEYRPELIDD